MATKVKCKICKKELDRYQAISKPGKAGYYCNICWYDQKLK